MRTKYRLNSDACAGAFAQDKPAKYFDGDGLFLYVTPRGSKHWRVAYRIEGRAQTASIGSYPGVNLERARELCAGIRTFVKNGVKPPTKIEANRLKGERSLVYEEVVEALHYERQTGVFTWRYPRLNVEAGEIAGHIGARGYRRIGINGVFVLAHRLAWFVVHGVWPTLLIDHINGDRKDNRIENLRDVTAMVNAQNKRVPKERIGLYGVRKQNARGWGAYIEYFGKRVTCGPFNSPEEAHEMYLTLKRRLHDGCTI